MPLSEASNRVEAPGQGDWKPVPEDVYHVVIKDVEEKIMKKFKSEDEDAFYVFKLVILDEGEDIQGQSVNVFCARKWFGGSKKASPSKLVTLTKAVYAFYYPRVSVIELEADDMTPAVFNDMIGKQLRVAVKINEEGTGNKVSDFMAIKKELEVPEDVKIAPVAKKNLAKPGADAAADVKGSDQEEGEPLPWEDGEEA